MAAQKKSFHIFNCDNTYNLDAVEMLLLEMKEKIGFDISVFKHYFRLSQKSELCSTTIPELQMDFAVFVVHANESRLSINEDNAGIGYAKIYRALVQATDDKVLIVVGGDDNYKNEDEEDKAVISRWARRKIASQFNEEYLDGRKSFIFSWYEKHRLIHEEALLHYFDPQKTGQKFVAKPKAKIDVIVEVEPPPNGQRKTAQDSGNTWRSGGEVSTKGPSPVSENTGRDVERHGNEYPKTPAAPSGSFWGWFARHCNIL